MARQEETKDLLELLGGKSNPSSEEFKKLIIAIDSFNLLAKVFLLEGTPYVFEGNPMKYVIFKEQVAERFNIGSQDVCIVGSARLGFSPSPTKKYGTPFKQTSDVDVVIISEPLFYEGAKELFATLNQLEPQLHAVRKHLNTLKSNNQSALCVDLKDWQKVKEALRNYVFDNFNPGLLPEENKLRQDVFSRIASTAGLFLALEPKVFVSKIRGRIFRTWKSAEDYYANSLRQLKQSFAGKPDFDTDSEEVGENIEEDTEFLKEEETAN